MSKTLAHGAKLLVGDGEVQEEFTEVPYIGAIGWDVPDAELVDVTTHTETSHEELPGLDGIVDIAVPITWDPSEPTHIAIRDKAQDHDPGNWQILTNSGTTLQFSARIRSRKLALGIINKAEEFTFSLRVYSFTAAVDA